MKKAALLGIAALSSLLVISTADARTYVRSCNVSFRVIPFERGLDPVDDTIRTERFTARASGGWYIPNTIRLRAFRRARNCINTAWSDPYNGAVRGIPAECNNSGGNGIYGYNPYPSLSGDMAIRACHAWGSEYRGRYVNVRIVGDVSGNWGCGGDTRRKSWYTQLENIPYRLWIPSRCEP